MLFGGKDLFWTSVQVILSHLIGLLTMELCHAWEAVHTKVPVMLRTSTNSIRAFSWLTVNFSNKNHKLAFNVSQTMELKVLMYCNSFHFSLVVKPPLLNLCSTEPILCGSHLYIYYWPITLVAVIWLVQTQMAPQIILARNGNQKCSVSNKDPRMLNEYRVDEKNLSTEGKR